MVLEEFLWMNLHGNVNLDVRNQWLKAVGTSSIDERGQAAI